MYVETWAAYVLAVVICYLFFFFKNKCNNLKAEIDSLRALIENVDHHGELWLEHNRLKEKVDGLLTEGKR